MRSLSWFIRFMSRRLPRPMQIRVSYLFSCLIRLLLRGNKVECPVCERTFSSFLPFGLIVRDNVLCPACLSLERHRLQWLYLNNETDFFIAPYKVLHVAPEQCFLKRFRALKNLDYTTADLESPLADLHFDLHDIPLPDNQYDFIICNHVLEHVEDDRKVLREILRVLKPGGKAIMQVPLDYELNETFEDSTITTPSDREKYFGQKDHVRQYGLDYPDRLRKIGFIVDEIPYPIQLGNDKISRYRLPEEEILFLSTKPEN